MNRHTNQKGYRNSNKTVNENKIKMKIRINKNSN